MYGERRGISNEGQSGSARLYSRMKLSEVRRARLSEIGRYHETCTSEILSYLANRGSATEKFLPRCEKGWEGGEMRDEGDDSMKKMRMMVMLMTTMVVERMQLR